MDCRTREEPSNSGLEATRFGRAPQPETLDGPWRIWGDDDADEGGAAHGHVDPRWPGPPAFRCVYGSSAAPACGSGGRRHGDGAKPRATRAEDVRVDYAPLTT